MKLKRLHGISVHLSSRELFVRCLIRLFVAFGFVFGAWPAAASDHAPLPTVAAVDLDRYLGTWYEIALLPNRFERQCVSDTQAHYSMHDGGIRVLNRCRTADGSVDSSTGRAKVVPGSSNAKLKVTFFWPFYGDYWILALDPDYSEVLVGTPDRRYGWILSRSRELSEARVQALLQRASTLGFDANAFKRMPQVRTLDAATP